ncbi:uncharacterized protein EI90DRAFT_3069927, partial [Cantharellus anzutake]|uniref:uncharacterized protein n=1 Tax=Cantharellus anzutake TaxID=1750568 RepID=UPI0019078C21
MRFWNALVPLALLPIVTANFHLVLIWLEAYDSSRLPSNLMPSWVLVPSNRNHCDSATAPNSEFFRNRTGFSLEPTAPLCGSSGITVSKYGAGWNDSQGKTGECFPINDGKGYFIVCGQKDTGTWVVLDMYWCKSDWCKGRGD